MDEQSMNRVKGLFTEVGCILEDVSVVALIWDDANPMSAGDRYQALLTAKHEIGAALKSIETILETD
jgi:hypothetical protein